MGDSNLLAVTRRPSQEPIGSIRLTDLPCWPTAASQFSAWSKQVIASGLQRPAWCSTVKKRLSVPFPKSAPTLIAMVTPLGERRRLWYSSTLFADLLSNLPVEIQMGTAKGDEQTAVSMKRRLEQVESQQPVRE